MSRLFLKQATILSIISAAIVLVLGFQNCSSSSWPGAGFKSLALKAGGNGGGYEGKLAYYRFVPDMICEGKETYKEMLVFEQDQIWLYENKTSGNSCQQNVRQLENSEIGRSPFQSEFLIANDYLYAGHVLSANKVPDLLAESLCRDNWDSPSFEIINHFNYRTGAATTRVYHRNTNGDVGEFQDSTTRRLLSPLEVKYESFDQQLKYRLNLASGKGPNARQFAAEITEVVGSLSTVVKPGAITCVTGGGLDTSIWPLRKVNVSPTISDFFVHPTQNDIYFRDRNPNHVNWWRPFVFRDEKETIDISAAIFKTTMYVSKNIPIENSAWMMLSGVETDGTPYFGGNVYIYRPEDPGTLRTLVRSQSRSSFIPTEDLIVSSINQLSDSEFGYWIERREYSGAQSFPQPPPQSTYFYRIYNWKSFGVQDFLVHQASSGYTQSLEIGKDTWPRGFAAAISKLPDGRFELSSLNLVSRKLAKQLLPEILNCVPVVASTSKESRFFISQESHTAVIEYRCPNFLRTVLGISIETGAHYITAANQTIVWSSANGETFQVAEALPSIFYWVTYNPLNVRFVSTKSGRTELSQMDPHLGASKDVSQFDFRNQFYAYNAAAHVPIIKTFVGSQGLNVVGFSPGSVWNVRLKNLFSGKESSVCQNVIGEKVTLLNFSDDQLVLVTFEPGKRIYVYEVSETENCKLLNSAPVTGLAIRFMVPTKSGLGLALNMNPGFYSFHINNTPDEVYFLNKDGRAPIHINLDNPTFGVIDDMSVSFDHSKLYILGSALGNSIFKTLFWLKL